MSSADAPDDGGRHPRDEAPDAKGALAALATDDDTESVVADAKEALRARLFPSKAKPPRTIGRFEIRGRLGAGGMGVVYRGHDPRLDRPVAVKVLRPSASGSGPAAADRLEREARALAKLDHPNVVTVLEVGEHDGQTYVAMELVEGETLREWSRSPRSAAQVLDAYRQAGEGLAAAHERGLVHRDFKPHNAMRSAGGRVRVLDFGLVRDGSMEGVEDESTIPDAGAPGESIDRLTRTGAVVGTPAYMAPEQLRGAHADARSDQFALAVSVWEALAGARPFDGDSPRALLTAIERGPARPPKVRGVARGHWAALRRSLSFDPALRFSNVAELVGALRPVASRRWLAIAGVAVIAAASTAFYVTARDGLDCPPAEPLLRATWSEARTADIERRLGEHRHGATLWKTLEPRYESELAAWARTWEASCRDPARGEATRACLRERLRSIDATMSALEDLPPATLAASAVSLVMDTTPGADCRDEAWQRGQPSPPPADQANEVAQIRNELARARVMARVARGHDGSQSAAHLVDRAVATGYGPLEAEARLVHGAALSKQNEIAASEEALRKAVLVAEANRHDHVLARGLMELMFTLGYARRTDDALALVPRARAAIERLGTPLWMASSLELHEAKLALAGGAPDDAMQILETATERLREAYGDDDLRVTMARRQRVVLLARRGRTEAALAEVQAIVRVLEGLLGHDHPSLFQDLDWIARLQEQLERHDDVIATSERVLAASTVPNLSVARAHLRLGRIALDRGEAGYAAKHLKTARSLYEDVVGTKDPGYRQVLDAQQRLQDASTGAAR